MVRWESVLSREKGVLKGLAGIKEGFSKLTFPSGKELLLFMM